MLSGGSERYTHWLSSQYCKYNLLSHVARPHHAKSGQTLMRSRTLSDLSARIQEPVFNSSYSGSFKKLNLHYTSGPVINNQVSEAI